ncbi:DNA-dependent RNA polymerase subunit epsilon [Falsibacillus pallidus]|uniref:DNA-dependent RNA polymerase subunit epsilon n=1 Tax=Falsibacillus pallidus TaxID=493781 RepID=UPI003D958AB1
MIFKVFYQDNKTEVPVREKTSAMYVQADAERDVRLKLKDRSINIEFIQKVDEAHHEYEKQNEDFKVLEI